MTARNKVLREDLELYFKDHRLIKAMESAIRVTEQVESGDLENEIISSTQSFETLNNNLDAYPKAFSFNAGVLETITYTVPGGNIIKTLNYTSGQLTTVVFSGNVPEGIDTTKTINYSGSEITSISYS
jgi:hypothetical protein